MKNAGVSPVRPWLLTALRRAAETAPAGERRRLLRRARSVARQAGRRARFYRNDLPHVLRERAHLAALAGRRRRARSLLGRSLEVAKAQGARAEALRTRAARGEVGHALGWTEDVEDGERARTALERAPRGGRARDSETSTERELRSAGRLERGSRAAVPLHEIFTRSHADSSISRFETGSSGVSTAQRRPGSSGRARPQIGVVSEGHGEPTPFPDPPTRISGSFRSSAPRSLSGRLPCSWRVSTRSRLR